VKKNLITVQAHNPEQEEAEEEIEVGYDGADLEVGFNVNYLLDALAAIDGSKSNWD
jgi:DNA polymerase III subunit beta